MNRIQVLELVSQQGLLPPFHHTHADVAKNILNAAYAGGLRIIEFTNRSPEALAVFTDCRKYVQQHLPGMAFGIGTILHTEDAKRFYDAGADFIVAPNLNSALGAWCAQQDCFWCPGAFTPSEIIQAHNEGADLVKLFPADLAGPSFLTALRGPCPWVRVMPSGGVTLNEESIRQWLRAGASSLAVGSHLFDREILEKGNFHLLQQRITWLLETIVEIRNDLKTSS